MCRFLMIKSHAAVDSRKILEGFARMAERSRAPDGDRQGDGWGVSWLDPDGNWREKKSTLPIWNEIDVLAQIPESRLVLAHARSASFPQHKEILNYNQPFVRDRYAFVFNGLLKGVTFPFPLSGEIGSQKIWSLFSDLLGAREPVEGLLELRGSLERNSRSIHALNIGLCDKKNIYAHCQYKENPEYYHLHFLDSPALKMICSEPLEGFEFRPVDLKDVLVL